MFPKMDMSSNYTIRVKSSMHFSDETFEKLNETFPEGKVC